MQTFLEHVAQDLIDKYGENLAHVAVVFPNKRASLFLNQHLLVSSLHALFLNQVVIVFHH